MSRTPPAPVLPAAAAGGYACTMLLCLGPLFYHCNLFAIAEDDTGHHDRMPPQPSVPSSPLPVHGFLSSAKSAHSNIEKPNAKPTVVLPSNSWRRRPRCSLDRRYSIRWTQSRKYLVFITVFFFHYCYSLQSSYFPSKWTIHIQDQLWFFRPSLLYNIARPRSTAGDGTVP